MQCEIKLGTESYRGTVIYYSEVDLFARVENASHFLVGNQADITFLASGIEFKGEVSWVIESPGTGVNIGFKRVSELKGSLKDSRFIDTFKRSFKRYEGQSQCEIKLGTESYRGTVIDYSAVGVCALVENASHFLAGTQVDITFLASGIEFKGEVAWVKESPGTGVKIGFKRASELKGALKDFHLVDMFIGLQRSTRTGILEVKSGSMVKNIFIKDGEMIFASSNYEYDRLGELLLKEGKITLEEYNQSSYLLLKTGERLGNILVDLGCLTPKELFLSVCHQIEEIIISLFSFEEGSFEFQEKPIPWEEVITLRLSVANIIYRGIKRTTNLAYVKQICSKIDSVLNFSPIPLNLFQSLILENADKKILSYINGIYSIRTILSLSPLKDFETLKTLCALLNIGLINVKRENEAPVSLPIEYIFGEPEEVVRHDFLGKIEEMYKRCQTAGYYEMLGVEKNASIEEIKKYYYKVSKEFHPDKHFYFPTSDVKEKLMQIIADTTEAYETLSHPAKRVEYNLSLSLKASETTQKIKEVPSPEEPLMVGTSQEEEEVPSREQPEGHGEPAGVVETPPADELVRIEEKKVAEEEAVTEDEGLEIREEASDIKEEEARDEVPEPIAFQQSQEEASPEEEAIEYRVKSDLLPPEEPLAAERLTERGGDVFIEEFECEEKKEGIGIPEGEQTVGEETGIQEAEPEKSDITEKHPELERVQLFRSGEVVTGRVQPKRSWSYIPLVIIIALTLAVVSFILYRNFFSKGPERQIQAVAEKRLMFPPFREELFKNLSGEAGEQRLSLPAFRYELFIRMSNKASKQG